MPSQRQRAKSGASLLRLVLAGLTGLSGQVWAQQQPLPGARPADATPLPPAGPSYSDLVSEGKALLKADKLDEALAKFSAAIARAEAESSSPATLAGLHCLYGLAQSQAGARLRNQTIASLRKSLELDAGNADCRLELAKAQLADKQYVEARDSAQAVLTQPDSDDSLRAEAKTVLRRAQIFVLFSEARQLLKAHQASLAAQRLKSAIEQAQDSDLAPEERALLHYVRVLALREDGEEQEIVSEARAAIKLTPSDADLHLELARALFELDQFKPARAAAQDALRLGLSDADDQREAETLARRAKTEALREQLSFYGSVTFGYDSNVLQGANVQTINGTAVTSARSSGQNQTMTGGMTATRDQLRLALNQLLNELIANYPDAIRRTYASPAPSVSEWDLPITISFDLSGRLFRFGTFETRLGYQFYQYFLTSAGFDHDAYNRQEHTVPLQLNWQPFSWLLLRPHLDVTTSFTGLRSFAPYQWGLYAVVDATFIESRKLRTRLFYQHQLRRSYDRGNDAYLDADRDEAKLTQELRLRGTTVGLRAQLSYRLRSERTGAFTGSVDLPLESDLLMTAMSRLLGTFHNRSPLSYLGHEVATRFRLSVPWDIELITGASFEYRGYSEDYTATFTPTRIAIPCPRGATSCTAGSMVTVPSSTTVGDIVLPSTTRIDKTVGFDLSVAKSLPLGFGLELGYSLLVNFSTIESALDNRNYSKHQVTLNGSYIF